MKRGTCAGLCTAVVCALLCTFFTVFTGGSGVTILALGGLLLPALLKDGYRERYAIGLLTASGTLRITGIPETASPLVSQLVALVNQWLFRPAQRDNLSRGDGT